MTRRLFCVAAAAGVLAAGPGLASPAAQARTEPDQRPVFRAGVDVARIDLRVTDRSGRPIDDLRRDEVRILEDGIVKPVLLFQHVAESGRSYLESAQRTVAADVSTNQGAPRGQLYVLVFDQEHITSGAEQRVRLAAQAFLRTRVQPQDRVAVFGIPGPGPSQRFTANRQAALRQLDLVRGSLDRTPTGGEQDMRVHEAYEVLRGNQGVINRFITGNSARMDRTGILPDAPTNVAGVGLPELLVLIREKAFTIVEQADASSRRFLNYLADLLRSFRGIDGRKTVLLFSEGFHSDDVGRELEDVASAAAETSSSVYAFDLNRRFDDALGAVSAAQDQGAEIASRLESLGTLSGETDGRLIKDANSHLENAMGSLAAAGSDYYVVGFEPSAAALSDREAYRRVEIRVTRPGAQVRSRTGYAAGPAPKPANRRTALDAALAAPFSQQGLGLEYTTYVGQSEVPGLDRVVVSLAADLPVRQRPGDAADVVFAVRDGSTGGIVASGSDAIPLPAAPAGGSALGRGAWHVRFDLPAGTYLMRCVVREPGGLVGSADRRFTVRALDGPDVAASDLILGVPGDSLPVRAIAYTEELLAGALRVHAREADRLGDLSATLDVTRLEASEMAGDAPVRVVAGDLDAAQPEKTGASRDVTFHLPLSGLEAGDYVAHAVVRSRGEVVADLRRELEVVDGVRPAPAPTPAPELPTMPRARDVLSGIGAERLIEAASRSTNDAVRRAAAFATANDWSRVGPALTSVPATDSRAAGLRALACFDGEDYAAAAALLATAFDASPSDAAVAFVLGWARAGAGDETGAISAFRSAAWLEPTLVPAHLALAASYLRLHEPALAAQALTAGLRSRPDSVELKRMLGAIRKE